MCHAGLIIATLGVIILEWYLYRVLRTGCALRRPVRAENWESLPFDHVEPLQKESSWASELERIARLSDEQERAIAGMAWLMNRVQTVENPVPIESPERMLAAIDAGRGALCGQMACLFRHVLANLGLASRTVFLQRNPFDCFDDHTLVEARIQGRWILLDPTFNMMFRDVDGCPLDALEIKRKVFQGNGADVAFEFLGDVRYPIRIENYYVGLLSLFNNVYVHNMGSAGWGRLPPFRHSLGPRLYYVPVEGESDSSMAFWRGLYALTVLILPISAVLVAVAALSITFAGH